MKPTWCASNQLIRRDRRRVAFSPAAEDDLFEIWMYIARDNSPAADRLEEDMFAACQRLAERPDLRHVRHDLTDKPVRFSCVRDSYLIVYDPAIEPLEIVRVLHGARDIASDLSD